MIKFVMLLLGLSAVAHAAWNILLKTAPRPLFTATLAAGLSAAAWTPIALLAWVVTGQPGFSGGAWVAAVCSALLEVAYFVFLSRAYQRGSLSSVYAVARGTAPLLSVAVGVTLLSEHLHGFEIAGIAVLLVGIVLVRGPFVSDAAMVPAMLTGVTITAYSAVDSVGVHLTKPWLYGYVVWVLTATLLAALWKTMPHFKFQLEDRHGDQLSILQAWITGMLMTSTYVIVLFSLRLAPLALVAPIRESAIILVTGWGVWRLREREGAWMRAAGAMAVVAGATLLAAA